jgi:transcription antitermination factor NusG
MVAAEPQMKTQRSLQVSADTQMERPGNYSMIAAANAWFVSVCAQKDKCNARRASPGPGGRPRLGLLLVRSKQSSPGASPGMGRSRWKGAGQIATRITVSQAELREKARASPTWYLAHMKIARNCAESDAIFDSARWFAVRVKDHHETVLTAHLANYCDETFLPSYRSRRVWSDRFREIDAPLFPHYVFCRFPYAERVPILRVPGVYSVLRLAIPDEEIAGLRSAAASGLPCRPWPFLNSGSRVVIERGPLRNLTGIVVEEKGRWRLVLSVQMLHRSVAVELDREDITPVK